MKADKTDGIMEKPICERYALETEGKSNMIMQSYSQIIVLVAFFLRILFINL